MLYIISDVIRTYIKFDEFDAAAYEQTTQDLKDIVPVLEKYRIQVDLENHEYETADQFEGAKKSAEYLKSLRNKYCR